MKFTDKGFVKIKAKDLVINCENYVEISVSDTGAGIRDEDKNRLFKMFGYI